nr:MAG TPA: hypothetical protein [Caudoviricetes sp.]
MTRIIDPEFHRLAMLIDPYLIYDKEKKKFIIPEDAPKEIHEAAKRKEELYKENVDFLGE